MDLSFENLKSRISLQAFTHGLIAAAGIYAVLVLAAFLTPVNPPSYLKDSQIFPVVSQDETALKTADMASPPEEAPAAERSTAEAPPPSLTEGIFEDVPQGRIPKKSADGKTPFNTYKKEFTHEGRPVIALAVIDYGLSDKNSREALQNLPENISFILNPYVSDPAGWQKQAQAANHELWLYVPAENAGFPYMDQGPYALLAHLESPANKERLYWTLSRAEGYAGVAVQADSTLLSSRLSTQKVFEDIFDRGLGYIEINKDAPSFFEVTALARNAPYVRNQHMIGEGPDDKAALADLEKEARENGYAMGVVKLYPESLKTVQEWAKSLKDRGIDLAPVSAIAQVHATQDAKQP